MLLLTIVIVILTSVIGYFVNLHLSRRPYHHIKSVPLPHALDYIPGHAADLKRREMIHLLPSQACSQNILKL